MNDHKGLRPTTMKGASVFGDREPLFPRLHINETEKTGPKAPPRNKMALYEQFTVPSHRFLQPSQAPSATAFQQPHGSGYPYIPYYMPPVHYTNPKNSQAYSQLSQVTPNCGTISGTVMLNEESQKASKRGKVSPCKSSRGLIESRANQVASESPKKGPLKGTESLRRTFLPDNINELSHGSMQLDTVNEKQHAVARSSNQVLLSTSDEVMEGEHERCENPKDTIATDERNSDPISASISQLNTLTKQWHDDVVKLQAGEPPSKDNFSSQPFLTSNGKISNLTAAAFEPKSLDESGTSLVTENNSVLSVEGMAHGCAQAGCESKDQSHQFPLDSSLPKVDRISFDKSEIGCSEGAKLTQEKEPEALVMCGGRYPGSEVDCMPSLKPKDVIQVIGQQQFWKARKTLLRQQRIFSDQVFQLHKLTTVQHLLAETSGMLIDSAARYERMVCSIAASLTKKTLKPGDSSHNPCRRKEDKNQSENAEDPQDGSKDTKDQVGAPVQELAYGGGNAWGYPCFGQWAGPMATHGQPYSHHQITGTVPATPAFGFPYGSVSPMVSFGIPFRRQTQEVPAEMGSNFGSASKNEAVGQMNQNLAHNVNDVSGSWYFIPHKGANNQMMLSTGSCKDISTCSGASVNKGPASIHQGLQTSCFPGLTHRWGHKIHGCSLNGEGLGSSAQQSEISSPSPPIRPNCTAVDSNLSAAVATQLGFRHKKSQRNVWTSNVPSGHISDSENHMDKEDEDARATATAEKQGGSPCTVEGPADANVYDSLNMNNCALELFPLMPSLNSVSHNMNQESRKLEGEQGLIIRAVPRRALAASDSAAGILLSLQRERQK